MANAMLENPWAVDSYYSICGGTESESTTEVSRPSPYRRLDEMWDRQRAYEAYSRTRALAKAATWQGMVPKNWTGTLYNPIELSCAETVREEEKEDESMGAVEVLQPVFSQPKAVAAADPTGSDDEESSEPFDA